MGCSGVLALNRKHNMRHRFRLGFALHGRQIIYSSGMQKIPSHLVAVSDIHYSVSRLLTTHVEAEDELLITEIELAVGDHWMRPDHPS